MLQKIQNYMFDFLLNISYNNIEKGLIYERNYLTL